MGVRHEPRFPTRGIPAPSGRGGCQPAGQKAIDLLKKVRNKHPDLPFIIYTANGNETVASQAIEAGVTEYLVQRPETDEHQRLATRIRNIVTQSRGTHEATTTERRLRELSETTNDVRWMVTADWSEFLFINSAYEDIWGQPRSELEANPTAFLAGVHPEDRSTVTAAMEQLSDGESVDIEFRVNADENFQRWVWVQAEPITDKPGTPERIAGFARDITERKHQTERFQSFIEHSQDIVTVLTADGTYQYQSPSSARVLGYAPEELLGETAFDYVHPEDRQQVIDTFTEAVTDPAKTPTVEYRFEHADGSWRWLESIGNNQLDNPAIEGFVVNSRDITERKTNEKQLRQTRDRMAFALNATDAVVWEWNVETDSMRFHPAADNVFGTTPETREEFLNVIHPDDRPQARDALDNTLETGDPNRIEVRIRRDDQVAWIEAPGKPVETNGTTRLVGVARDITERKHQARQLQTQNERLERFAEMVSHDLRNPLTVAQGNLDLAKQDCHSNHLDAIEHGHDRMEQLIEDMLTLAREGEQVTTTNEVPLATVAEQSWTTVATGEATLITNTKQTINADQTRLEQLLENLFRNAVEHGPDNVTVTVTNLNRPAGFAVSDDGPGIPPDERDKAFERGFSTADHGTGFGLAIVREIAHAHGWECQVDESEAGGARFEFHTQPT